MMCSSPVNRKDEVSASSLAIATNHLAMIFAFFVCLFDKSVAMTSYIVGYEKETICIP